MIVFALMSAAVPWCIANVGSLVTTPAMLPLTVVTVLPQAPGLPTDFMDAFPKLKGICEKFGAIPEVKAYYAKSTGGMYKVFQ